MDKLNLEKKAWVLWRGFKRMMTALFTAALFGLSVYDFIATAKATGYWAVVLFISGIVIMRWAFRLLNAQGANKVESDGDVK